MPLVNVPEEDWDRLGVPDSLRKAVKVLNEALEIDREGVSFLLDSSTALDGKQELLFIAHPTIILRPGADAGGSALSALGLLGGVVNTEEFRISGFCEHQDAPFSEFHVVRVVP